MHPRQLASSGALRSAVAPRFDDDRVGWFSWVRHFVVGYELDLGQRRQDSGKDPVNTVIYLFSILFSHIRAIKKDIDLTLGSPRIDTRL